MQNTVSQNKISTKTTWDTVSKKLHAKYGEAEFTSWIKPISVISSKNGQATLATPTRFIKEKILSHYIKDILELWKEQDPSVLAIDILVQAQSSNSKSPSATSENINNKKVQDAFFSSLDPRFKFENFIVGKSNELAYAAANRVADSTEMVPHTNPLFLYGGVGLGKTHLMHAIAWHIGENNPQRKVLYLSAEKFMYQFIRALRDKDTLEFKAKFRNVDVLMIDDVQFISGKESTQEEFFHTFNALVDRRKQVILSSDRSPSNLDGVEDRIKSRLGWGLVVDIHATTYELRLGILQSKLEMSGIEIPKIVMEFLARKITSNVRELEGALNRIIAYSTLVGREITLELTQEVLKDLLKSNEKRITIELIQKEVADRFNIKVSDMHSARRSRSIARPRQIAMYLSKELTPKSLPEIGRNFGGKDHTTVIHAVKKVKELLASDTEFAEDVELLKRMLQS